MSQLWVDTDLGFDDMHALLVLQRYAVTPVACSLVFGCATINQVEANASGFEQAFDFFVPWHAGAACALDGHTRTAEPVLGPAGMQSRGSVLKPGNSVTCQPCALDAMIQWLSTDPTEPQVLALGPLTNIGRLIVEAPQLAGKITRITWMGGSEGRGNQTEHAEFNAWADAQAAAVVMQSGIHVNIVELEACRTVQLFEDDLQPLRAINTSTAHLLHDLLGGYLDIALSRGRPSMALYDPVAAVAVLLSLPDTHVPQLMGDATALYNVPVNISVDTGHERRGQTHIQRISDNQSANHSLMQVADPLALRALVLDALVQCADANVSIRGSDTDRETLS